MNFSRSDASDAYRSFYYKRYQEKLRPADKDQELGF